MSTGWLPVKGWRSAPLLTDRTPVPAEPVLHPARGKNHVFRQHLLEANPEHSEAWRHQRQKGEVIPLISIVVAWIWSPSVAPPAALGAGQGSRARHRWLIISATVAKLRNTGKAKIGSDAGVPSRDCVIANSERCVASLFSKCIRLFSVWHICMKCIKLFSKRIKR